MALDVYVGSLTRYYARDWENPGQRAAAELGIEYHEVVVDMPPDPITDRDEIRELVLAWRDALARGLGDDAGSGWEWSESGDEPWFSERPAWDGWGALLLHAAYTEHPELERPTAVRDDWAEKDAAFRLVTGRPRGVLGRLRGGGEARPARYASLYRPELWLPIQMEHVVEAIDPDANALAIASVGTLLHDLRDLNGRTFALDAEIDHHRQNAEDADAAFDAKARWGLGVFLWCAERAVEHQLPMKLDY